MIYWKSEKRVLSIHMMHCVYARNVVYKFCTCYRVSCMEMHNKRNSFIFNRNAHDAPKMSDFERENFRCMLMRQQMHFYVRIFACEKISGVLMFRSFSRCSLFLKLLSHFSIFHSEACKKFI